MKSKRIIAILFALSMCLLISVLAINRVDVGKYIVNTEVKVDSAEFQANRKIANEASENLLNEFRKNSLALKDENESEEEYTEDGIATGGYPEYYAGEYINVNGELVILLTDDFTSNAENENKVKENIISIAKTDQIVFGSAEHSYSELVKTMEEILNCKEAWIGVSTPYKLQGAGIKVEENRIDVFLSVVNKASRKWFRKNVSSAEYIELFERSGSVEATAKYGLNTKIDTNDLKFKANMEDAGETNTNLQKAFLENYLAHKDRNQGDEGYTVNMIPEEGYPEYYAGSYVNGNGELVVLIDDDYTSYGLFGSEKEAQAKAEIIDLAQTNNIVFGEAKYSYRELINTMTEIVSFIEGEEANTSEYVISSIALNSYENTVKVYLTAIDKTAINWFRDNVSAAKCITFIKQEKGAIEAT